MKFDRSPAKERYMKGLFNAESKGYAAGLDPAFSQRDNPYKTFEHRTFWQIGFKRARTPSQTGEQAHG